MLNEIDVLVACGGKCGSSTLRETFLNNNLRSIKIHYKKDFEHQFKYDGLIDLIERSSKNKKLLIIDAYRNPIERKISSFFEHVGKHVSNYKEINNIQTLINIFNNKYLNDIEEYHSINLIMDEYNIKHFENFDFKNRFIMKEHNNLVFIKILYSDIKRWDTILSYIFEKNIIMKNSNLTDNKPIYNLYNEFKKKYKVPINYINNILINDENLKIYNTQKERKEYINYWKHRSY